MANFSKAIYNVDVVLDSDNNSILSSLAKLFVLLLFMKVGECYVPTVKI